MKTGRERGRGTRESETVTNRGREREKRYTRIERKMEGKRGNKRKRRRGRKWRMKPSKEEWMKNKKSTKGGIEQREREGKGEGGKRVGGEER